MPLIAREFIFATTIRAKEVLFLQIEAKNS